MLNICSLDTLVACIEKKIFCHMWQSYIIRIFYSWCIPIQTFNFFWWCIKVPSNKCKFIVCSIIITNIITNIITIIIINDWIFEYNNYLLWFFGPFFQTLLCCIYWIFEVQTKSAHKVTQGPFRTLSPKWRDWTWKSPVRTVQDPVPKGLINIPIVNHDLLHDDSKYIKFLNKKSLSHLSISYYIAFWYSEPSISAPPSGT